MPQGAALDDDMIHQISHRKSPRIEFEASQLEASAQPPELWHRMAAVMNSSIHAFTRGAEPFWSSDSD
jgi:hypothetical protein